MLPRHSVPRQTSSLVDLSVDELHCLLGGATPTVIDDGGDDTLDLSSIIGSTPPSANGTTSMVDQTQSILAGKTSSSQLVAN
jgi:hypothetical protein